MRAMLPGQEQNHLASWKVADEEGRTSDSNQLPDLWGRRQIDFEKPPLLTLSFYRCVIRLLTLTFVLAGHSPMTKDNSMLQRNRLIAIRLRGYISQKVWLWSSLSSLCALLTFCTPIRCNCLYLRLTCSWMPYQSGHVIVLLHVFGASPVDKKFELRAVMFREICPGPNCSRLLSQPGRGRYNISQVQVVTYRHQSCNVVLHAVGRHAEHLVAYGAINLMHYVSRGNRVTMLTMTTGQ